MHLLQSLINYYFYCKYILSFLESSRFDNRFDDSKTTRFLMRLPNLNYYSVS